MAGRSRAELRGFGLLVAVAVACSPAPEARPAQSTPPASSNRSAAPVTRPATWARRLERPGLPNLHQVDAGYYRGAQPTAEGMAELVSMGIRTVVNLRALHSDRDEIGKLPLGYEHISAKAWHAEDEDVIRFLKIVTNPEKQPIFVHCQHGADRTGTMTAVYRIVIQGWSKDNAIAEMTQGDFGFHTIWQNLVRYIRELDVEKIRAGAGLPKP
jgi:protein tyrosine/serine phosphatase